jgi:hypothetical protein
MMVSPVRDGDAGRGGSSFSGHLRATAALALPVMQYSYASLRGGEPATR